MKIGPLTLFQRMHSNGRRSATVLVASWHWKWSLTWRWHMSWSPGMSGSFGPYYMRVHKGTPGINFHAGINLPFVGSVNIQTQPNMPTKRRTPKTEGAME